ncbi:anion exchange protein 4 isoform X3 [Canis lupus baileyi]|uniref:anion exchange protein 4 isoform X3 n=1 Tax=Canis lupus familiaris TaxID=9615 RepID=UPI0006B3C8F5|nr:anion exchange protein 4 isoform X3 [Canis lupus familiaris]XP_025301248.1 anion exchange protein 4 isoform X3 [Canis lupus dingo]XP_038386255.1 anion exchange protein 4 isoform X3 [Canis lupus familiaris]XP_038514549.1 anion exchange protein 4 isoform X3 [Canis lupus familiaris]|eukprot:XP_013963074.1 anion exchange protein 4 isoform X3 [Canis lupus familiaris]
MKLPGQEEFEVSSACKNVPTGELDSSPGSGPSPDGPLNTKRGDLGVSKDPLLFIQLNELLGWPQALEWRETGRWVLFEEKVEVGAGRWSVPHVPTLALSSLQKLHSLLAEGLVLLDCPAQSFLELVEQVTRVESLSPELRGQLQALLLQRPQHLIQPTGTRPCQGSAHPREASYNEEALLKEQRQNPLRQKLPPGAEAAAVLAGELGFLVQPLGAFVRLRDPVVLGPLMEVPLPSRFFCLLLGPSTVGKGYHEIGRAMAVLLSDSQFQWTVRRASNLHDLLAALDAFLEEVTVLPPGLWDPTTRIAPPKCLPSQHKRLFSQLREVKGPPAPPGALAEDRHGHWLRTPSPELQRTGRLFGGLLQDVRRKASWYPSDFLDALHPQCLSAVLCIYLATVTNAITFGGLLGEATSGAQGVLESFLGTAAAGATFCLMAGQPLTILSSTGPVLVFERLLFSFSRDYSLDYLPFRLWVGIWVATFCLALVATEASVLVRYFTRFTEEGFCALISLIFIYDAVGKMLSLTSAYPIQSPGSPAYGCFCQYPDPGGNESQWTRTEPKDRDDISSMDLGLVNASLLPPIECARRGGHPRGPNCHTVPDIAFFSLLLFLTSFLLATALKHVKTSRFFPSVPTLPGRGWLVSPFGTNPWWLSVAAALPALLLSILIFMDQQITAVILNRAEYKLRKGAGFHLDLFCVALLMLLTSVLGLPWYVSATVISLAHMDSLRRERRTCALGEPCSFLGIREQRLTGLVVFILTGTSIFLAPVLKFIPMPVLYGIFLYMGVAAMSSTQFTKRVQLLLMPAKHQPDLLLLRHVSLSRVHLFTAIQLACLGLLWIIKSTPAAIIFPLTLLGLVGVRKALERVFSPQELLWLDELMPEKERSIPEKGLEPKYSLGGDSEHSELMYQPKAPEINISVN